jgi:predicted RNA binding protein YcfA (HicA-like mRNA interferase family)
MSRHEKLLKRILSRPSDFEWDEAVTLLNHFGFEVLANTGSRRKFKHIESNALIIIHKPHPGNILKDYAVKEIIEALKEGGFIL